MMTRLSPQPLVLDRVRSIPRSFSWIDRAILTANFLPYLTKDETALYFFLVTAANKDGLSFYGFPRIGHALGLTHEQIHHAIAGLARLDLIAFRFPFFQVLSLPPRPPITPETIARLVRRKEEFA